MNAQECKTDLLNVANGHEGANIHMVDSLRVGAKGGVNPGAERKKKGTLNQWKTPNLLRPPKVNAGPTVATAARRRMGRRAGSRLGQVISSCHQSS